MGNSDKEKACPPVRVLTNLGGDYLGLLHIAKELLLSGVLDPNVLNRETDDKKQLRPGDVIFVERMGLYRHYGVYVGKGEVIHYSSMDGDFSHDISIHKSTMDQFLDGAVGYHICRFPKQTNLNNYHLFTKKETVQRAYQRLGERQYNLLGNNCEHFAIWCRTNISESGQVKQIEKFMDSLLSIVCSI